jgi:hypothetical protein
MRLWRVVLALPFMLTSHGLNAKEAEQCVSGDRIIRTEAAGFSIVISRYHDPTLPPAFEECRAIVRDQQKHVVFSAHGPAMALVVAGKDVDGDGFPDLVLEGDSSGMHGTSTYYVVSLGEKPKLILKFQTEAVPAHFIPSQSTRGMEIQTWDGNFFMFDDRSTAGSPYPMVYFRIEGNRLIDISRDHVADYDKAIRQLRAEMPVQDLAVFLKAENKSETAGTEDASGQVLKIVLAYLYSGRQTQAHNTLRKMWPPFDQERVWELILKTRREGILRYTRAKV